MLVTNQSKPCASLKEIPQYVAGLKDYAPLILGYIFLGGGESVNNAEKC